ncbi:MAG: thioredoxin [Clostridia bacterium]
MRNKIILIVLIIAFIGIMLLLNNVLQNKTDKKLFSENVALDNQEEVKEMVIKVNSENFETEVLNSEKTVLIDFYADWCGPCKMLSPIVEQVASENTNVKVVKINIDDEQDLAINYGVMSIPTLVVIKNGQETDRVVGLIEKSEVEKLIK